MRRYYLSDEELDLIQEALGHYGEVHLDMSTASGDADDLLHTACSALENELLWQKTNGERRPIWQNYNTLEAWQEHTFISSSGKTPDFVAFAKLFKAHVVKITKEQFEITAWTVGHFFISGFLRNKETGRYVYFSIPDVRFQSGKWADEILIRSARNNEDYTGGHNNYTTLERFTVAALALSREVVV